MQDATNQIQHSRTLPRPIGMCPMLPQDLGLPLMTTTLVSDTEFTESKYQKFCSAIDSASVLLSSSLLQKTQSQYCALYWEKMFWINERLRPYFQCVSNVIVAVVECEKPELPESLKDFFVEVSKFVFAQEVPVELIEIRSLKGGLPAPPQPPLPDISAAVGAGARDSLANNFFRAFVKIHVAFFKPNSSNSGDKHKVLDFAKKSWENFNFYGTCENMVLGMCGQDPSSLYRLRDWNLSIQWIDEEPRKRSAIITFCDEKEQCKLEPDFYETLSSDGSTGREHFEAILRIVLRNVSYQRMGQSVRIRLQSINEHSVHSRLLKVCNKVKFEFCVEVHANCQITKDLESIVWTRLKRDLSCSQILEYALSGIELQVRPAFFAQNQELHAYDVIVPGFVELPKKILGKRTREDDSCMSGSEDPVSIEETMSDLIMCGKDAERLLNVCVCEHYEKLQCALLLILEVSPGSIRASGQLPLWISLLLEESLCQINWEKFDLLRPSIHLDWAEYEWAKVQVVLRQDTRPMKIQEQKVNPTLVILSIAT
jgi:hypothetical protein